MKLLCAVVLAVAASTAHAQLSNCALLDSDGCCGVTCQAAVCQTLYISGQQLGAAAPDVWFNREGWEDLYSYTGAPNTACQQYLSAAAASEAEGPPYCSWHGIMCNATAYSTCSRSKLAYGVSNITLTNNNLSGILDDRFARSIKQLHDCGLQTLVLGGASFWLNGTISSEFGQLTNLKTFSIFGTSISGKIPSTLGNMTALQTLDLNTNYLTGAIPPELGRLSNLQHLNLGYNGWTDIGIELTGIFPRSWLNLRNLEVLMLDQNGIEGTIPDNLCSSMTKLRAASFANNHFHGTAHHFGGCVLTALDLSDNRFTGRVPVPMGAAWSSLQSLRLNNNRFSGPLPSFEYGQAPQLSTLVLSNNSLTGTIPVSWTYLPFLTVVEASFNSITGSLPWQLAFQSRLWVLALDNNPELTGIIEPAWRFSVGLTALRLHNTDISGPLPGISRTQYNNMQDKSKLCGSDASGLGRLPLLQSVTISDTNMTAKCGSDGRAACTDINDTLPWYLNLDFDAWVIPLPEEEFSMNEHMQCPAVTQEQYCYQNGMPINFSNETRPNWDVSPSYYHYLGCRCQTGYTERRETLLHGDTMVPVLRCVKALTPAEIAGISVAVSFVGLALLLYLGYVSWYGRFGLPKLKRAYDDVKKRLVGAPTSGRISVIVTDIEGYSALMVAMPLVMGRAMSQHNNACRKAAWTHFGFTVGQEGDSYILAFSDALDAVAFCLQFQQALRKIEWPQEMLHYLQQEEAARLGLYAAPPAAPPAFRSLSGLSRAVPDGSRFRSILAAVGVGASSSTGVTGVDESGTSGDEYSAGASRESSKFWSATSRPQRSSYSGSALGSRLPASPAPSGDMSSSQARQLLGSSAPRSAEGPPAAGNEAMSTLAQQSLQQPHIATATALVPGLRVRMGIASGVLGEKEHDVLSCRVLEVARVVSDAAIGGQVLMDSTTFKAIKDRLEELGQVGPNGYYRSNRVTGWGTPRGWLAKLVARHSRSLTAEAQVLDMGMYTVPGFKLSAARDASVALPELPNLPQPAADSAAAMAPAVPPAAHKDPAVAGPAATPLQLENPPAAGAGLAAAVLPGGGTGAAAASEPAAAAAQPAATLAALQRAGSSSTAHSQAACLRLYQVLAPKLVHRAHLFGNRLTLKDGSVCHDLPYFSAPAAATRPTLDADLQQPLLYVDGRRVSGSGSSALSGAAGNSRKAASVFNVTVPAAVVGGPATNGPAAMSQVQLGMSAGATEGQAATQGGYLPAWWQQKAQAVQQQQQAGHGMPQQSLSGQRRESALPGDGSTTPLPAALTRAVTSDDAVTFVFCSVVIPRMKLSMDTNPKLTAQVSSIVGKVIRECLMAFARTSTDGDSSKQQAGGYLCRDLGGDMKYMLAFCNPRVALEWCLLVQEVLLWQDWPASLLEKPGRSITDTSQQQTQLVGRRASMILPTSAAAAAAAAWGPGNGVLRPSLPVGSGAVADVRLAQPLFRGPRVKMGVCSGSPQSVTPDHQGRADYHGNAVNMAARFEAICAQGGQIVCEASLAEAVVAEWAALQASGQDNISSPRAAETAVSEQQPQPVLHLSPKEQRAGTLAAARPSPFQAASGSTLPQEQQQQAPADRTSCSAAAAPSLDSLVAGPSFSGLWAVPSSPAVNASSSFTAGSSYPTAGEALSKLVEDSDAAMIPDAAVAEANATAVAAAQAAATALHSQPLAIPGRLASCTSLELLPKTTIGPTVRAANGSTSAAGATSPPVPAAVQRSASARASTPPRASHGQSMTRVGSGDSAAALGGSAGTASTSTGLLPGFLHSAASSWQLKGHTGAPRRSARTSKSAGRAVALMLAPAPTELACPSCVPELPLQPYGVEVHQVGKFLVKGHSGPLEIVEVLLTHLSARRQLLDGVPKAQKGRCLQVKTGKVAEVQAVQLPCIAQLYRQQLEQRMAAAAAAAEPAAAYAAQQVALSLPSASLSFSSVRQLELQHPSGSRRAPSMLASLVAAARLPGSKSASSGAGSARSLSLAHSRDSSPTHSAVHGSINRSPMRPQQQQQQDQQLSSISSHGC